VEVEENLIDVGGRLNLIFDPFDMLREFRLLLRIG
jgi:hypothetical protein